MTFEDSRLASISAKIAAGHALDSADAQTIYRSHDLLGIAQLANSVREKRHGRRAYIRQDLQAVPMTDADRAQRINDLLHAPAAERFEPPLDPVMSGHTYLKHVAVARLLLPQVEHIEARLCPQVENVCQLALDFGADTLIGADTAELERQVSAAGRELAKGA